MANAPHLNDLIALRVERRAVLAGLSAAPLLSLTGGCARSLADRGGSPSFQSVPATVADTVTVAPRYTSTTLISWGDPLFTTAQGPFDPDRITRPEQELRFGTNNDMLALFSPRATYPEPEGGSRAILCANNEHFEASLMYPSLPSRDAFGANHLDAMYAALGVSIVQIERAGKAWRTVVDERPGSGVNRRITPFTPVEFSGPAARHRWIAQAAVVVGRYEPSAPGTVACGTMVNCAGGKTPWGTYLTCEEGFPFYFSRSNNSAPALEAARGDAAWAADGRSYSYPLPDARLLPLTPKQFDLSENPMGPSLYGWVVEIDPYDPASVPKKRTALGRRWNEGASTAIGRSGQVAVYCGDDTPNQFVYKFVTAGRFAPRDRAANMDLLNTGTLYVARFEEDGSGHWIALTDEAVRAAAEAANHHPPFRDFGDMLMRTREAAKLLGATPMDRPEDIEPLLDRNWVGLGPVLINCTGNATVKPSTPGNPRREPDGDQANFLGHILRLDEDGGDSAATTFRWDVFALCGDPTAAEPTRKSRTGREVHVSTTYAGQPTFAGDRFSSPDNLAFDQSGNVWVTTNGMASIFGDTNDAVVVMPLDGPAPRRSRTFLVGPVGAEICGPCFSFDHRTFFAAIQHPGSDDTTGQEYTSQRWPGPARPPSSWPRGGSNWPLPSVIAVTKDDGGIIGS